MTIEQTFTYYHSELTRYLLKLYCQHFDIVIITFIGYYMVFLIMHYFSLVTCTASYN